VVDSVVAQPCGLHLDTRRTGHLTPDLPSICHLYNSDMAISSALSARCSLSQGFPPERLELEITESVLLQDNDHNVALLHQLKDIGVSIVLDDFGIGYSSLTYLKMFPWDKPRIDRSFVEEITTRAECSAIACAIVGLGRALQIATTAEGIETEEQCVMLQAAGCNLAQGFLFGPPVPNERLLFGERSSEGQGGRLKKVAL
jgi:EAL domain-containing protein (putative c-di-GMP-specific phosphodiesterase class I)